MTCKGRDLRTPRKSDKIYIEREFIELKKHWQILLNASMFHDICTMTEVMYTCIILQNMILDHEGNAICVYEDNKVILNKQPLEYGGQ